MNMKKLILLSAIAAFMLNACKKEIKDLGAPSSKMEGIKANWVLSQAVQVDEKSLTRESSDITRYFVLGAKAPNISFTESNYTVDTVGLSLNFFGGTTGKWAFDDPKYPSKITFTPDGGTAFSLPLNGPIRPTDHLKFTKLINHVCKGDTALIMSYNLEFIRK